MLLSLRRSFLVILMATVVSWGCAKKEQKYDGPAVDAFLGRLTHNGNPVNFPENEQVSLRLVFEKAGGPMDVPVQSDGTFKIGSLPIGKYSATLVRSRIIDGRRVPRRHTIPEGLTIQQGKTEYTIELGPNWKS